MFDRFGNGRSENPPLWALERMYDFWQNHELSARDAKRAAGIIEESGGWAVIYPSLVSKGHWSCDGYPATANSLAVLKLRF